MSNARTRRSFLQLSAAGFTATATVNLASALTSSVAAGPTGDITVRGTSGKLRYAAAESLKWRTAAATAENAIVLDPGKMFQRSGQYWAFAHFSRNVRRRTKRLGSACQMEGVEQVAFENPDGQKVLIVTNSGLARTATLKQGNDAADVNLAADSLRSLLWS